MSFGIDDLLSVEKEGGEGEGEQAKGFLHCCSGIL